MGREGFEPSKAEPTDLQSAPFDRSGTSPVFHDPLTLLKRGELVKQTQRKDPCLASKIFKS